jgi:hypothetical protein
MASCKLLVFIQFFSLQSSAWLLTIVTIDRYITVASKPGSFMHKLPFKTKKSAVLWSLAILMLLLIFNLHIIIFDRITFFKPSNISTNDTAMLTVNEEHVACYHYKNGFELFPTWEIIHVGVYSIVPSLIMLVANVLLIYKMIFNGHNKKTIAYYKKRNLSISIIMMSFLYILMTLPGSVSFAFFIVEFRSNRYLTIVLNTLDCIVFLNHSIILIKCFIVNSKFRNFIIRFLRNQIKKIKCKCNCHQ